MCNVSRVSMPTHVRHLNYIDLVLLKTTIQSIAKNCVQIYLVAMTLFLTLVY